MMDGAGKGAAALRLFWWKARANFGDALSALVVAHVAGRPVVHAGAGSCDLVAIGSLLQVMRRKCRAPRADGVRPWVWGSGLLQAVRPDFLDNVRIATLRGPVTAAILGVRTDRFGDPGLLAPDVLGPVPGQRDRVGLVPHHSQMDEPWLADLLASEPALELIDVRQAPEAVCRRIAGCAHVIAASLHGLVVADAYGVANTWLSPGTQSHLKYHDYAAGIGRPMIAPVEPQDIPAVIRGLRDTDRLAYADGIARAREILLNDFPAPLRATPDMAGTDAGGTG